MKIILTGSTGFVGQEILAQCLAHPAITAVVALSRKPIPLSDPKLTTILHDDFTQYPAELLAKLDGATACIWAQGQAMPKSYEVGQLVNHDFPLAAARAMQASLTPQKGAAPFRFVYCSGALTEKNQDAQLWFLAENRKLRGRTEVELMAVPEHVEAFKVHVVRPGVFTTPQKKVQHYVAGLVFPTIGVDVLARKMIDIALNGIHVDFVEMDELLRSGK